MIRKLRLKIVGISLVTVAAVLLSALVVLALSTRSQMVHSSEEHLAAALEGNADKNQLPGSSGQPCFVAEVFTGGTIRLSGSSYYNLENQDLVLDIVRSALEEKNDSGVLKDYSLRYMRRVGVVSVRIAFTDCSMERATMRSLLLRGGLVTLTALLVLTGLSYWLAGFAVRPVRRAWQEQKQFVSDASHELKTPLTSISGFAEIIQDGLVKEEDIKKFAGRIYNEAQRLITLVEDTIKVSQLDEGENPYEWEKLDAYTIVKDVCGRLREVAEKKNVHLYIDGGKTMLTTVHPILDEVIYNLCDNGIKYNKEDGTVSIHLRDLGENVEIRVKDNGIGIPKAELESIRAGLKEQNVMEYDEQNAKLRRNSGRGIGLQNVHQRIGLYYGNQYGLEIYSEEGEGTEVIIRIPTDES